MTLSSFLCLYTVTLFCLSPQTVSISVSVSVDTQYYYSLSWFQPLSPSLSLPIYTQSYCFLSWLLKESLTLGRSLKWKVYTCCVCGGHRAPFNSWAFSIMVYLCLKGLSTVSHCHVWSLVRRVGNSSRRSGHTHTHTHTGCAREPRRYGFN